MSDICKCSDSLCPKAEFCYRFTAPADELRQAWFAVSPRDRLTGTCHEYIPETVIEDIRRKVEEDHGIKPPEIL